MVVSWSEGYHPNQIIQRLEETKILKEKGDSSFEGFTFKECTTLLYDLLNIPDSIPETEGRRIISHAVLNVGKKGKISTQNVLDEVNRLVKEYLKQPKRKFVLVTSLSIHWMISLPIMRINGATIKIERRLPNLFRAERNKISSRFKSVIFSETPKDYLPTRIWIEGRSEYEACENALDTLDLLRGIWNWFENRRHFTRMSSGSRLPINNIAIGPIHTMHEASGKLATETFWYEANYRAPIRLFDIQRNIEQTQKFYKYVKLKLRKCKYRVELEKSIIEYTRALDERDWHIAFIKLWSVLERLTNTGKDSSYDVTVRRASFVFSDRDYQMQVLKVLKDHRNKMIHASANPEEIETYLYQLKYCVEVLIEFHLGNHYGFSSLQEASIFLDLPVDKGTLISKIKLFQFAQQYRGYKPNKAKTS